MTSKFRVLFTLTALLVSTIIPLNGANAAQTRSVVGGALYNLQCNANHDLQLSTVNIATGIMTNIGDPALHSTTGITTCINSIAYDSAANTGFGYVLALSYYASQHTIHTLNLTTGAVSAGVVIRLDSEPNRQTYPMGFTVDSRTHSFYALYTRYDNGESQGIYVAKINPTTGVATDRYLVARSNSVLEVAAAARFVPSGFAFNPADSKFYILTGNSDGGNRDSGLYHLWRLDPTTGGLDDLSQTLSPESKNSDGITPHSFFSMAFDNAGTIWGVANSQPRGYRATQSATVSGWSTTNNLSLSTASVKADLDGEDDYPVFVPSGTFLTAEPFPFYQSEAAAAEAAAAEAAAAEAAAALAKREAATAAAAKREAEIKKARADISKTLAKADKLTADSFAKADIAGVTSENIAQVQAEILALPAELRTDINQVLKVARKYEVVGKIASEQATTLPISAFVEVGLIPAESKNKAALIAAVRRASADTRDSFADIQAVIAAEAARIQDRKDRLAATLARLKSK